MSLLSVIVRWGEGYESYEFVMLTDMLKCIAIVTLDDNVFL